MDLKAAEQHCPAAFCLFLFNLLQRGLSNFCGRFHTNVLPPHVLEPKYPGAYDQLVNLCDCWDPDRLCERRSEIARLCARISALHAQSTRFLGAFGALMSDNYALALEHTDLEKIRQYAARLATREMHVARERTSHEDIRFLSAVSDCGVVVLEETAKTLAKRIYVIDDEHAASARALLCALRQEALTRGLDIISCPCPTEPQEGPEHLFIPALSLGFMTANRVHPLSLEPLRVIHARRFTDMEALRLRKQRLAFNRKAAMEMLRQSTFCLHEAKKLHDQLEAFYIQAMDFEKLDSLTDDIIRRMQRG